MIVKAYAKINIALGVTGKRDDGFHNLDMIVAPLDLHDSIEITAMPAGYDTLVTCDACELTTGDYNLCTIAVNKMREFFRFKENFRIHIHKRIPMSAGLGGGSSDAAAVVKGIMTLLKLKTTETDLIDICRAIGSDVPFFFKQKPARVRGTGEILDPIFINKRYYVLLIKPTQGLATKDVYMKYDENVPESREVRPVIEALKAGDDTDLAHAMFNDLEPAAVALCPEIAAIKRSLKQEGLELVSMSGSGSTVFALSDRLARLEKAARKNIKPEYVVLLTELKK